MHGTGAPLGRYSHEVPVEARAQAAAVAAVLSAAHRVLILGHQGADGDVAGSCLGLAQALRELRKDVVVYNGAPWPEAFAFLPGAAGVQGALSPGDRFDATVVLDAARADRLGQDFPDALRRGVYIWIDHHKNDDPPGDVNFIDLTAAATGECVALVLDVLGHPLSKATATCLYASLCADTGGFRYDNTSVRAFELAARLVRAGVSPWEMTERLYESQDEARVRLLARALSGLWRSSCGRLGVVEIKDADLDATGASDEHVQGIVNHVRAIRGVEVAVLLRQEPGGARAVFRSRGVVDIAPIAQLLGGRGHKNAATVALSGALPDARTAVVEAALTVLRQGDVEATDPRSAGASPDHSAAGADDKPRPVTDTPAE